MTKLPRHGPTLLPTHLPVSLESRRLVWLSGTFPHPIATSNKTSPPYSSTPSINRYKIYISERFLKTWKIVIRPYLRSIHISSIWGSKSLWIHMHIDCVCIKTSCAAINKSVQLLNCGHSNYKLLITASIFMISINFTLNLVPFASSPNYISFIYFLSVWIISVFKDFHFFTGSITWKYNCW
jgi:hypothetical protein